MDSALLFALSVGLIAGVIIGTRVARRSRREEPVYGGRAAEAFHWLACAAFTGGLPAGLTNIIFGRNLLNGIALALSFIAVSLLALIGRWRV